MIALEDANETLTREVLGWTLPRPESQTLETKRVSENKMVAKALKTICAFANTRGGWLLLGVEDAKKAKGHERLFGVGENPEAVDEVLRKLDTHFLPAIENVRGFRMHVKTHDGAEDVVVAIHVPPSEKVHSILEDGTWIRFEASNREMNAAEIAELHYHRGVRSAESEPVDVDFDLLDTDTWRIFLRHRDLAPTGLPDQLFRIGLAKKVDSKLRPVRAAVLLFADQPGALLAATGTRADVRVFHYQGNRIAASEVPNLKKPPKTLSGPIYKLIAQTHAYLLEELAGGLTLVASGFQTVHRYPERVLKEAVTNALIHRDYRLNQDVQIRIFDNRIEVISPGLFPGRITAAKIQHAGSFARNPLLASNLREFPEPPNVDAGEGVRMMFSLMREKNLFPPQYQENRSQTQGAVSVTLYNAEMPPIWEQVSDWMDRNGLICNSDLRKITGLDTLKASKQLKDWVEQGLLVNDPAQSKRNMVYRKPASDGDATASDSLSIIH